MKYIALFTFFITFSISLLAQGQCGSTAFWSRVETYNTGDEVQLDGVLYRAKWWNRRDSPDVNSGSSSLPWEIVGNCDGSVDSVSCFGVESWVATDVYDSGNQVVYGGSVYQANYYTTGQFPDRFSGGAGMPWIFIGACSSSTGSTCDASTPSFSFDLTGAPDSAWVSAVVRRDGLCCSIDPNERPPARCVEFFFTLDEDAIGIIFDIETGAVPPGALYYQINCQGRYQFGDLLCLSGVGPYRLTFCKPGNNPNTYRIQSVGKPKVSPPVTVSDGCSADLFAEGYDLSTVEWSSVPSNPVWESYLSCTSQCDSVHVSYEVGAPDSVVYQVSGFPPGGCLPDPVIQQTVVYFVNEKYVEIQPQDAMVCFGNTDATLTAYPSGGRPPHRYLWSTGETTQSIDVGQGDYWVEVFDNTTCPSTSDSVVVGAFLYPIEADAGPDQTLCVTATEIQLAGQVFEALGGRWSGGLGNFVPNDSTLDAIYQPAPSEISFGSINLTLTTTGNRSCPGDVDDMLIYFNATPTLTVTDTAFACTNNPSVEINSVITEADGVKWTTSGGGIFLPNDSALTVYYSPTSTEISNGNTLLTVTTVGGNGCPPLSENVVVSFTPSPLPGLSVDQTLCSNNPIATVVANPIGATGVSWSGGLGTYSPNNTSLNTSYTPTASEIAAGSVDLIATTTGNGTCLPVSDNLTLNFSPSPTISTPDVIVCQATPVVHIEAFVTNASGVIWSGGSNAFNDSNALSTTYTPSASDYLNGSVVLTATTTNATGCIDVVSTMTISFFDGPSITAPSSAVICSNNPEFNVSAQISNADGVSWSSLGSGTFTFTNELNTSYAPSSTDIANGSVDLVVTTVSSDGCPEVSTNVNLSFSVAPIVNATTNTSVCENNPEVQLNGLVNAPFGLLWTGGAGTFSPSRNVGSPRYTPTADEINTGLINFTLVSTNLGDCLPVNTPVEVVITPAPVVELGSDLNICVDQLSIPVSATTTNSISGQWSGGSGTYSPNGTDNDVDYFFGPQDYIDSAATLFYTTAGNAPCLEVTDFVSVRLTPNPVVDAGVDIALCTGQDTANLDAAINLSAPGRWLSSGTGQFFPNEAEVKGKYVPSLADIAGGSVTLTLTSDPYQTCNQYNDEMIISFVAGPVIDLGPNITVCKNQYPLEIRANGSLGSWVKADGTLSFAPNFQVNEYIPSAAEETAGNAFLVYEASAFNSCPSLRDTLFIDLLDGPSLTEPIGGVYCANSTSIDLNSIQSNASGVQWTTTGDGNFLPGIANTNSVSYLLAPVEQNIIDTLPIQFTVQSTGNGLCPPTTEQVTVQIIPQIAIDLGEPTTVCLADNTISLDASLLNGQSVVWSTNGGGAFLPNNTSLPITYGLVDSDTLLNPLQIIIATADGSTCPDVSDTALYFIDSSPLSDAGIDRSVCRDVLSVQLSGSVQNNTDFYWSTSGTGYFEDPNALSTNYIRSNADTASGQVTLYLNAVGVGTCPLITDSLLVTFIDPIKFDWDSSLEICKDSSYIDLSITVNNAGGADWTVDLGNGVLQNPSSLAPRYMLDLADETLDSLVFLVTSTGNLDCYSQSNRVVVSLLPTPSINSLPSEICQDNNEVRIVATVNEASSLLWSTDGGGSIVNDIDETILYQFPASDTLRDTIFFFLETVGNGLCQPVRDTTYLVFSPKPEITTISDQVLCYSDTYLDVFGNVSNADGITWFSTGSGQFVTDVNLDTARYVFSNEDKTGSIPILFVATSTGNGTCLPYFESLNVTFSEPPVIDKSNLVACQEGDGSIPLTPNVTNASRYEWKTLGSGTFTPSAFERDVSYIPSVLDRNNPSITIRLVASSCASDSVDFVLFFQPKPQVTAPADGEICQGLANELVGTASGQSSVEWHTLGSGSFSPDKISLVTYYTPSAADIGNGGVSLVLEALAPNSCPSVYDTVQLAVLNQPSVVAGRDVTLCRTDNSISLSVNANLANAGLVWSSSGLGVFNPGVDSENPTYVLDEQDRLEDTLVFYVKTLAYDCFEEKEDSLYAYLFIEPNVNAGPDQIACSDDLGVVFGSVYQGASNLLWSTSGTGTFDDATSTNPLYFFSENDINNQYVTLRVRSIGNVCEEDQDEVELRILDTPMANAGLDKVYCNEIPNIPLSGEVSGASDWEWFSDGAGLFSNPLSDLSNVYEVSPSDTSRKEVNITLMVNQNSGCLAFDQIKINFEPEPNIIINPTIACVGETITLTGRPSNFTLDPESYIWSKDNVVINNSDSIISVSTEGLYKLVMKIDECLAEKTAAITFNPSPNTYPSSKQLICLETGSPITLIPGGIEEEDYRYYWVELDDSTQLIKTSAVGVYNYTITNRYGCSSTSVVNVEDACPPRIFAPSIMTPNGDGKNDEMVIAGKFVKNYNLTIFNRWGEVIFYTEDINDFWKGDYRSSPMPEGVYNWIIRYSGDSEFYEEEYMLKGIITIVR